MLPDMAKAAMMLLAEQFHALVGQIQALNRRPLAWHRQDQASQRLATIPGVGVLSAAALEASVTAPVSSDRVRNFPLRWAWSRDRTDQAAKTGWVITLRWETANAGSCS